MPLTHVQTVPILRSFSEAKAREFYLDFLGFQIDWEHRFEPSLPLYLQVSRTGIVLHISEHHGDATPGSAVRIGISGLRDFHAELIGKHYGNMRPGLQTPEWGGLEMTVIDPAGNRLHFVEAD
ncbi:hypothetical protein VW29_03390 [Devosia limi DSM 17137]|uniref:Bleomycin resistance protein n=1 Tax=Devosia limi DSM 17137 TaxID=1121477 RepID=A0A0F5LV33_9HYPH|nr:glyoxalase superfamily protein [Devosia limi]KKB86235.1 hypothetical protein VW29_03055 [Devosia limi DSM 17137]KKB86291.1 hypothetical protein VW29_03390 [Devosia limi DSM 17137]SHF14630.1 hypothetical protein SAMN02745223_01857 [Devosia limi DSM 17137]